MLEKDEDYYIQRIEEALFESDLDADANAEIENITITAQKTVCLIYLRKNPNSIEQLFSFESEVKIGFCPESMVIYNVSFNLLEVEIPNGRGDKGGGLDGLDGITGRGGGKKKQV
jgi:hypothetical protein